jgi:transposase
VSTLEPKTSSVRRLEVFTGTGRRRRFTDDDKARIVEETLAPGAVVSDVARRHGLSPQQLFTWRREARRRSRTTEAAPVFVPAVSRRPSAMAKPKPTGRPHDGVEGARPAASSRSRLTASPFGSAAGRTRRPLPR